MYSEDNFEHILPPPIRIPNATTAYLLGLGPMPSPSSQDLSVAALYSEMERPGAIKQEDLARMHSSGQKEVLNRKLTINETVTWS